jgi:hypothetical protein
MRLVRLGVVASVCLTCFVAIGLKVGDPPGVQMKTFADAFLGSLSEEQQQTATVPYDSEQRVDWHFIPKKTRKGLRIGELNTAQRTAALRLLRAALSEAGYDKASKIMLMEAVIRALEGKDRNWERDPLKYFVTIFGTPSDQEPWALSWEGHHLSLNFSIRDGKVVDSTPQFWGANPGTVMDEVDEPLLGKGTRLLRDEEELAFQIVTSLDAEQQKQAIIAAEAPKEIRFAGEAQVKVGEPEGIAASELSAENMKRLQQLVHTYTNAVPESLAAQRRNQIETDGWPDVHFAWAGATKPGIGHYYRIRGKRFLIEFVNTQADAAGNPANHIHCVWRDVSGDFDLPSGE